MNLTNKKISIIGAKRSGIGAAKLVKRLGGIPFVSDSTSDEKMNHFIQQLENENIQYELGAHSERVFDAELFVVSPGVPSNAKVILDAKKKGIEVLSEVELAFNFCAGTIISITGTNGKTTTTAFLGHVLNECGLKSFVAGNIGLAFSEIVLDVKKDDYVSLETSSFQLDYIKNFRAKISMILNITIDHLDRYDNKFENYVASKYRIFENQTDSDALIINDDNEALCNYEIKTKAAIKKFSFTKKPANGVFVESNFAIYFENGIEKFRFNLNDLFIRGEHNWQNAMAVIIAAKLLGVNNEKLTKALCSFRGVEHRLELVKEIDGVKYINDSKATNIDSVIYALKSFDNPIILILGGKDKGNDYSQINDLILSKVKKIYALGSSREKIFKFFHKTMKVEIKETLKECVDSASKEARSGDIVLLSPACASWDQYENFEQRGNEFKKIVETLF